VLGAAVCRKLFGCPGVCRFRRPWAAHYCHAMAALSKMFLENTKAFGLSVYEALSWEKLDRDLDLVELWAGVGSLAKAAAKRKLVVECVDTQMHNGHDMTTLNGFRKALELVRRLRRGGLLMMGPPCNSFAWMSSSHHKRNEENGFQGDWTRDQVHAGNLQVDVAAFFFAFAYMEGIAPALENPLHSCMWRSISAVALQNELCLQDAGLHHHGVPVCLHRSRPATLPQTLPVHVH